MSNIIYSAEYDFIFYFDIIANLEKQRSKSEAELKNKIHSICKDCDKEIKNHFDEAEAFFKSLSFIQRNTINLFFHRCDFMKEYLVYLKNVSLSFNDMSYETLTQFIKKLCEMDDLVEPKTYDECLDFVKSYYDAPESDIDFAKTANLLVDMLNDKDALEGSIKPALLQLYDEFYKQKVEPNLDVINAAVKEHQILKDKDSKNFLFNLSKGYFDPADLDTENMLPIMTYLSPYSLLINISYQRYIYGFGIDKFKKQKEDKDLYEPLLKFLSDPKRYQMIQKLSTKRWYSNELAKEFNITPATMSYHVNKLFGLGVIHFEQGDQNRMYMELDKKKLKELLTNMQNDLLKE